MFVIPVMFTFKSMLACREDRWATPCLGQPPPPPHVHPFLGAGTRQRRSLLPADLSGDLPIRAPPPFSLRLSPPRRVPHRASRAAACPGPDRHHRGGERHAARPRSPDQRGGLPQRRLNQSAPSGGGSGFPSTVGDLHSVY